MSNRAWVFVFLVLAAAAVWIALDARQKELSGETAAAAAERAAARERIVVQRECTDAVREYMLSPSSMRVTDAFGPLRSGGGWRYALDVESSNAFGVMLPSGWLCEWAGGRVVSVTNQD